MNISTVFQTLRVFVIAVATVSPGVAQMPPGGPPPPPPPAGAASTPESLALARDLVVKSGGGGLMTMTGLSLPMAETMRQFHVRQDQSKVVMSEAIMPVLLNHTDELTTIQIESYAARLSPDTMKAAIAFYDSKAGREFVQARGPILQLNMRAVSTLFKTLMPEFGTKVDQTFKEHGWQRS